MIFCSTRLGGEHFIRWTMKFAARCGTKYVALLLPLVLMGCRHSAPLSPRPAAVPAATADPSTNVMIVPASAGWKRRSGNTNKLPSGIITPQPFPFPEYDQSLVKSVYGRWQELLKARTPPAAQGVVVVEFELHDEGSVSRIHRLPSEVTPRLEQLCEQAIREVAPFPKWTPEMKAEIGADTRLIRISFDYNALPKVQ